MFYKKHILSILLGVGISFSAHTMYEDQLTTEDSQITDAITKKYKAVFDKLTDKVSMLLPESESDIINRIAKKTEKLRINLHERHKSQQNLDAFNRDVADTRNDLALLPDDVRKKVVSNSWDKETFDLLAFLENKDFYPHEELNPHYSHDITPYYQHQEQLRNKNELHNKGKTQAIDPLILAALKEIGYNTKIAILGTATCAAIAGTCYYVYKKYWKKEQNNIPNKPVIVHVKKRTNLHKNIA